MDRGVTPVVAVVLLVAVTVAGVAAVASVATGLQGDATSTAAGVSDSVPGDGATIAVSALADGQRIAVVHRGGAALDLRNHTLAIRVDGEPLAHQPPVPYFAAPGFRGTPTGAFNSAGDAVLAPGDRAALQLASTNAPQLDAGDPVTVTVRRDGRTVATASVRAG